MKNDFTIERLSETNFNKFHRLFCEVFDAKTSYDFLYKKYDTSYLGEELKYIGYLAFNQAKEAVSYCGIIPFLFEIENQKYIGAHSCDHMTRADARKQGLFVKLNTKADELTKKLGLDFIFGFPNQNNHPILVKYANWQIIDTMKVFEVPVRTLPLSSLSGRLPFLQKTYRSFLLNRIKNKISPTPIFRKDWNGIIRNKDFYDYKRYSENYTLQLKNGKVWFKIKGVMFVGDIEIVNKEKFTAFMDELKNLARLMGIHKIIFIGSSNLPESKLLSFSYQAITGNGVGIKLVNSKINIPFEKLRFTLGDYDTF